MDNFSQDSEIRENDLANENVVDSPEQESQKDISAEKKANIDDIKFEDTFDIEEIQRKLQERMESGDDDTEDLPEIPVAPRQKNIVPSKPLDKLDLPKLRHNEDKAKKFVIYIDPENIGAIEDLSLEERRKIINSVIRDHKKYSQKQRVFNEKRKIVQHILVACLTFIISFPVMLFIVNASLDVTSVNYKQARENILKLYKNQGKIKPYGQN